ncbi:MAG: phosphonate C-P lyase system protein PhnH [Deltaproteobacteria bacterium]|nr:phosphonate C-P lyase system protein PhnH [Deltaproteobacteria bacterium]
MVTKIDFSRLIPGFSSPIMDSQRTFRALLDAMANPGRIIRLAVNLKPPKPLDDATASICLTLLDFETRLWTDLETESEAVDWLRFHCGCPIVSDQSEAVFGLYTSSKAIGQLEKFKVGRDECPEASATVIIQTSGVTGTGGKRLTGPGIETLSTLAIKDLKEEFWENRYAQCAMFPLGIDIIFTCKNMVVALPRTTKVED